MKHYYLNEDIYTGDDIPEGAIEITEERYRELESAKMSGKLITVDNNGNPVASDPIFYKDRKFYLYSMDTIPEGALEVSEADYRALMDAVRNGGKMIDTDDDGKPVAVEPYMFYSQGGFYDPEIHTDIPAGAVKILKTYWQELIDSQAAGNTIEADADGRPVSVAPPAPTLDELKAEASNTLWRNYKTYQQQYVDAEDLTLATTCAANGSEKGSAVQLWVMQLWAQYYTVKDAITATETADALAAIDLTADAIGEPPYTIRELNEEAAAFLAR